MPDDDSENRAVEPISVEKREDSISKLSALPEPSAQADAFKRIAQKSLALSAVAAKATVSASKSAASWIAQKTREQIESQRQRRAAAEEEAFVSFVARLRSFSHVLSNEALAALDAFEEKSVGDSKSRIEFTKSDNVRALLRRAESRQDFLTADRSRQQPGAVYSTNSGELLSLLQPSLVSNRLSAVKAKYYVSNASNVVAGAIFGARGNGAGSAAALAQSARVGHYNGKVKSAFGESIRQIAFSVPRSKLESAHHLAIVMCHRLIYFGFDEDATAARSLFCLVYANGHADAVPPNAGEFSSALYPEFHNNFKDQIWTIQDSIGRVGRLYEKNARAKELLGVNDLQPSMKQFVDKLPSYEEILGKRSRK